MDSPGIESRTRTDRPSLPSSFLYNGYWVLISVVKRPGRGFNNTRLTSAEVKEKVVITVLLLWAFMVCSRVNFIFTFTWVNGDSQERLNCRESLRQWFSLPGLTSFNHLWSRGYYLNHHVKNTKSQNYSHVVFRKILKTKTDFFLKHINRLVFVMNRLSCEGRALF